MDELSRSLRAAREAAGLSLADLAWRTHYSKALIGHLETGKRAVKPEHVEAYSRALGVEVTLDPPNVEHVRRLVAELVAADVSGGGDAGEALRAFRHERRRVLAARAERDLHAAVGELGEVAGWLLFEAERNDEMRSVNLEALHLSRMARDSSTELLTLQNMALHAEDVGQPGESLAISQMVLEARRLSPRLTALFRAREARALAQLGDTSEARRMFRLSKALHAEGARDDDPSWSWWVTDTQMAWHEGHLAADSGDHSTAIDALASVVDPNTDEELRLMFSVCTSLALMQARAHSREAATTIAMCETMSNSVRSVRSEANLRRAVRLAS